MAINRITLSCRHSFVDLLMPFNPLLNSQPADKVNDAKMYSRDETVAAVLSFYRQIIKLPYLDEAALLIPPANGWDSIDVEAHRARGKNGTVIDLLRHLPYLCDNLKSDN